MIITWTKCQHCGVVFRVRLPRALTAEERVTLAELVTEAHHSPDASLPDPRETRIFIHPDAFSQVDSIEAETGRRAWVTKSGHVELRTAPRPAPCPNPQDFHPASRMDAICDMDAAALDRPLPRRADGQEHT